MRLCFLDVDGVLNSEQYWLTELGRNWEMRKRPPLDPVAVRRLGKIVRTAGARIVVSSSWRHWPLPVLDVWLRDAGYIGPDLLDKTPFFHVPEKDRGDEIACWLHNTRLHVPIESFVILDDDPDAECEGHLVQTDWRVGLQDEHVDRAVAILTGKSS